jgi:hypothetical protein
VTDALPAGATFQERLAKLKEERAAKKPKPAPAVDADLIPEAQYEETEEDVDLDRFIKNLDIVDVYNKWAGKTKCRPGNKRESIKVSCPNPAHPDKNPSAWLNRDKNVWYCSGCDEGGDVYEIAAWYFGYQVPGYKEGSSFHKLREDMAVGYGYSFLSAPGIEKPILVAPEEKDGPEGHEGAVEQAVPDGVPDEEDSAPRIGPVVGVRDDESGDSDGEEDAGASVTTIYEDEALVFPTLDWEEIVPKDTFLDLYMQTCRVDDIAEEYHFWNGLLAVGFAAIDVTLFDRQVVPPNLFICLLGRTGDGKSRSFRYLVDLLRHALPYKHEDENSTGVRFVKSPASAESLIHQFSKPILDPVNPKIVAYYAPVRGLIDFNELSALTGRANRSGNVIKDTLLEFYDGGAEVSSSSITTGQKKAENPFASAFTSTQPASLRDLVESRDGTNGFLNRWVFVSGKAKKQIAIGGAVIDIRPCVSPLIAIRSWAGRGKTVQWDHDAAERFTEFHDAVLIPMRDKDETGMLARNVLLMKKLILLFCANEHSDTVNLDIVNRVIKMYPYIMNAYGIPMSQMVEDNPLINLRDDILKYAEKFTAKNPLGMTMRDLTRSIARKNYPPGQIIKMINDLVELQMLKVNANTNKGRVGRPTVRYAYVG